MAENEKSGYAPFSVGDLGMDPDEKAKSILVSSGFEPSDYNIAVVRAGVDMSYFVSMMWQKPIAIKVLASEKTGPAIYVGVYRIEEDAFDPLFQLSLVENLAWTRPNSVHEGCDDPACPGNKNGGGTISPELIELMNNRVQRAWNRQFEELIDPIVGTVPTFKEAEQHFGKSKPGDTT